jgi:hypothetical protein
MREEAKEERGGGRPAARPPPSRVFRRVAFFRLLNRERALRFYLLIISLYKTKYSYKLLEHEFSTY